MNTLNEDGSTNISPLSSSWALGDSLIIGISIEGKAFENLQKCSECVINIPHPELWKNVEALAPYTGKKDIQQKRRNWGILHLKKINFKQDNLLRSHLFRFNLVELQNALFN